MWNRGQPGLGDPPGLLHSSPRQPGQPGQESVPMAQRSWDALEQWLKNMGARLRRLETMETANGAQAVPTVLFADLPLAVGHTGWVAFVSNGRKVGEGAGMGTGVLCYSDGVNWETCDTSTPVAV